MFNLLDRLSSLPEPTAFDIKTYDELLDENVALAKEVLGDGWIPLESDPYMRLIRVLTLRQLHNQTDKKETVKQSLIATATGADLDVLGAGVGVFRDKGEFPYAKFLFKLLAPAVSDRIIPAGTVLNDDDDTVTAQVVKNVIIPAGEIEAVGVVELEEYVKESEIKTENIVTELSFTFEAKQLEPFANGKEVENDERFRVRIIESFSAISTAGAEESYKYHAFNADSRIKDVAVIDERVLEVDVYVASIDDNVDELMLSRVKEALNAKKVRPLNDKVTVHPAILKNINITATIELFDLLRQKEIEEQVRKNLLKTFYIGENFTRSDLIRRLHIDGVYRVITDFKDVITSKKEIIHISEINLEFAEAKL